MSLLIDTPKSTPRATAPLVVELKERHEHNGNLYTINKPRVLVEALKQALQKYGVYGRIEVLPGVANRADKGKQNGVTFRHVENHSVEIYVRWERQSRVFYLFPVEMDFDAFCLAVGVTKPAPTTHELPVEALTLPACASCQLYWRDETVLATFAARFWYHQVRHHRVRLGDAEEIIRVIQRLYQAESETHYPDEGCVTCVHELLLRTGFIEEGEEENSYRLSMRASELLLKHLGSIIVHCNKDKKYEKPVVEQLERLKTVIGLKKVERHEDANNDKRRQQILSKEAQVVALKNTIHRLEQEIAGLRQEVRNSETTVSNAMRSVGRHSEDLLKVLHPTAVRKALV